ncbi:HPr-rel-A system PqqD family peptide chaperone [Massilia sp. LXY-6]|uniref:HPr-rel-A system PqqD family peptide chaperone n=1 Tax=Massilia sp. LXY-6 TaxID=3379823 RepID=UPI003EE17DB5
MWRVVPGQSLAFREWDGEVVLYNDLSGNTHLLDGGAIDVLQALRMGPADAATLAAGLAEGFDTDADELSVMIEDMLAGLATLDLVELIPC